MAKKKSTTVSSRKYRHAGIIKLLAAIGAIVAIVFHVISLLHIPTSPNILREIVFPILGIIVCLILLGSLGLINHRWVFPMTWISILILGILDVVFDYNWGDILIFIAAFVAIVDRL